MEERLSGTEDMVEEIDTSDKENLKSKKKKKKKKRICPKTNIQDMWHTIKKNLTQDEK